MLPQVNRGNSILKAFQRYFPKKHQDARLLAERGSPGNGLIMAFSLVQVYLRFFKHIKYLSSFQSQSHSREMTTDRRLGLTLALLSTAKCIKRLFCFTTKTARLNQDTKCFSLRKSILDFIEKNCFYNILDLMMASQSFAIRKNSYDTE